MNKQQQKIIKDVETRLKTIMIGSISRVEKSFGYLWNYGAEPENQSQELFADKWEELRMDLLNHGNHQIRSTVQELENFFETPDPYDYNYNFILKNKNNRS
jgi:hypothetical protein